ncbi:O-antigen ligase domain-containing protein [Puteibacter caeruleilacunae]|nr:O-antigen ligase domain-containing protein [Puteibacter caeruleilacunae]
MKEIFTTIKSKTYLAGLLLMAICLPLSESFVSISTGILLFGWLIEGKWKTKLMRLKEDRSLILVLSIFFVYLIGMFFTHDLKVALYDLRKNIFILILPLIIATSIINRKTLWKILGCFVLSVNVASILSLLKLFFREKYNIENIWEITYISHIRFSFQLILAIAIIGYYLYLTYKTNKNWYRKLLWVNMIFLVGFLLLLKSLIGIISFIGTGLYLILFIASKSHSLKLKRILLSSVILLVISCTGYLSWCVYRFYDVEDIHPEQLEKYTVNGNPYSHNLNDKQIENGHYVYLYICNKELEKTWNQRSSYDINAINVNGFRIYKTLIRYLTSKGLRKDSMGIASLSDQDIHNIEQGIANHIHVNRFSSLYPRIYNTLWEIDVYLRTGDPNYMSLAQRIEFLKAAITIIKDRPILGVGTGNWKKAFTVAYEKNGSLLRKELYSSSHNQYLNYMVKFGILGFCWIMFCWISPVFFRNRKNHFLLLVLLVSIGISNLGDSNLESHMGLSFFSFFYCLFVWAENISINSSNVSSS